MGRSCQPAKKSCRFGNGRTGLGRRAKGGAQSVARNTGCQNGGRDRYGRTLCNRRAKRGGSSRNFENLFVLLEEIARGCGIAHIYSVRIAHSASPDFKVREHVDRHAQPSHQLPRRQTGVDRSHAGRGDSS